MLIAVDQIDFVILFQIESFDLHFFFKSINYLPLIIVNKIFEKKLLYEKNSQNCRKPYFAFCPHIWGLN